MNETANASLKKVNVANNLPIGFKHIKTPTQLDRSALMPFLVEGSRVLNAGLQGGLSNEIARNGFQVVSIDESKMSIAHESNKAAGDVALATVSALPFRDSNFDTVIIPQMPQDESSKSIIEEAIRVTANGGRIVTSLPVGSSMPPKLKLCASESQVDVWELSASLVCSFFVRKQCLGPTRDLGAVDIVMPTYNSRATLRRAIQSVLAQTYMNWNLVIVNDGGEDVSDIIAELGDARIRYVLAPHHLGKSGAVNIGLMHSNSPLVGYMDDDDTLYPLHVEKLVAGLGDADVAYDRAYLIRDRDGCIEITEILPKEAVGRFRLLTRNLINHKSVLHRRSVLSTVGSYDEGLDFLVDWDFILRLFFNGLRIVSIPDVTSEWIIYHDSKGRVMNRITSIRWQDPGRAIANVRRIQGKIARLRIRKAELLDALREVSEYWYQMMLSTIPEKDGQIEHLKAERAKLDSEVANVRAELAKTSTDLTKTGAELEAERARQESELAEKNITLDALRSELQEMQSQRAIALEELDLIRHSFGYKVMRFYGSLIDRLLRDNTLRGESNKSTVGSVGISREEEEN